MATNALGLSQMTDRDPMVRGSKSWFMVLGGLATFVGVAGIALSIFGGSAMTSGKTIGLFFGVAAIVQALLGWRSTARSEAILHVTFAVFYAVVGIALAQADGGTVNRLTGVLGFFFAVAGMLRIVTTIRLHLTFWRWNLLSAIVTSTLGAITLFQIPNADPRIFTALIGMDLLYYGLYALDLGMVKGTTTSASPSVPSRPLA